MLEVFSRRGQGKIGLIGAEEHALQEPAVWGLVVDGKGAIADWLCGDDPDDMPWFDTGKYSVLLDVFELQHRLVDTTCH